MRRSFRVSFAGIALGIMLGLASPAAAKPWRDEPPRLSDAIPASALNRLASLLGSLLRAVWGADGATISSGG